jgi:hypothetical protein
VVTLFMRGSGVLVRVGGLVMKLNNAMMDAHGVLLPRFFCLVRCKGWAGESWAASI